MNKMLLLGSLVDKKDPTKTGGITVLFELLLAELRDRNVNFDVIDTYKGNYSNSIVAYLSVMFQLVKNIRKYDHISLQATANSFVMIAPVIIFMAKTLNKKTSVRKFAGNFNEIHMNANIIKKYLIEYVLKNSDVNFFETKYLVNYFKVYNEETYWFPNVRKQLIKPLLGRKYNKRFVFIGSINKEKGIDELCSTIQNLPNEYIIDIYGPINDYKYSEEYFKNKSISYVGALKSEDVLSVLNKYDVLVLPSHREGYPGVIIEAFSLGIPIIGTKLSGIMEMVENEKNGLLIDIKNSSQLTAAIISITNDNYKNLSKEALASFKNFNSEEQSNIFLKKVGYYA